MQDLDAKHSKNLKTKLFDEYKRLLQMDHPFRDETKLFFNGF
jgi:hypothetical protein